MAKTIERYEIRAELGRGGMAAVYLAYDPRLDRQVALKLMDQQLSVDPAFAARFEREAKTVASLDHSAIVTLHDYGEADGWLYLVMRYMEGGSLKEQIAKGPLSSAQTYDVVRRIGGALDKAHRKGIIHRDLKPANILLDKEQEPYLSDFGIVKVAKGDTEFLTETGQTLGTFAYMSPEQVMGQEIDGRSDLYTLGIVLYEMLTGKHPFGEATTSGAMAVAHAQQTVPDVTKDNPAVSPALNEVVQKAMAKDPGDRYASGREMTLALYAALTGKTAAEAAAGASAAAVAAAAAQKPEAEAPKVTKRQEPEAKPSPAPATRQPAAVPTASQPAKQPVAQSAAEPAAKKKRKTPVWIFAVVGIVVVACIAIAAVIGLSTLDGDDKKTNGGETAVEEVVVEEPAAEEEPIVEEPEQEEPTTEEEPLLDLKGETVTIFTALPEEEVALLEDGLRSFEERTGVDAVVERSDEFISMAITRAEAGDPPDIYHFPELTTMIDMAHSGHLVDLNQFLDDAYLRQQYKQSLLDMGTVDGALVAVWHRATPRAVVYYHKGMFEEFGFLTPQNWDELMIMTEEFAASGVRPWCIGIESGAATGWVGTNWVEDILLRTAGSDVYDQWVAGDLPFSSSEVQAAFEIMGQIWHTDDFVFGGTESIVSTFFGDAPTPLFDSPPGCVFHYQGTFIPGFFPEGAEVGVDVDYFSLPPIDEANFGRPLTIFGSTFSLAKDTPAGRATMEYLTTGESTRAGVQAGTLIAAHNDVPLDWYPDDIQRGYAQILADADTVRHDGSDMMPGEVGAGTFWAGITDYVNGVSLDTVLRTIDASWP